MRIGISIGWSHKPGGFRTVAMNVVKQLTKIDRKNEYVLFANSQFPELVFDDVQQVVLPPPKKFLQDIWDQFILPHVVLPRQLKKHEVDLIYYTDNLVPLRRPCRFVVMIHDLAPFQTPETFKLLHRIYQHWYFKFAVKKSPLIITISECSKKDIHEILGVPLDRIHVIPEAVAEKFGVIEDHKLKEEVRKKYNLPEKIILNVGTIQPRKNLGRLLSAYKAIKDTNKIPHKLVIVGRKGWLSDQIFDLVKELDLSQSVIFTGSVPEDDLPVIYNLAELFVFPSIYEGFGLPPLEAMACGVPVITSNVSSIPEVVGDAALLIDPYDENALREAIVNVLHDLTLKEKLINRGREQIQKFSWERTARETLQVFEKMMALKDSNESN